MLDIVAENAARLCEAVDAHIFRVDGEQCWRAAAHLATTPPRRWGRVTDQPWLAVPGRAIVDRQPVHIHDIEAAEVETGYLGQSAKQRPVLGQYWLRSTA